MQIGDVARTQSMNVKTDVQKRADHVHLTEETKALVKQHSTDFLFEMGTVKVQLHKENRTEFQKKNSDSDQESFANNKTSVMEEMKEEKSQLAELSVARKRVNALFKPTKAVNHINLLA